MMSYTDSGHHQLQKTPFLFYGSVKPYFDGVQNHFDGVQLFYVLDTMNWVFMALLSHILMVSRIQRWWRMVCEKTRFSKVWYNITA
jgi:hypothetical protein